MPFVDLVASDDYASLWYSTNTPYSNVGSFTPDKQTIVMLHPFTMDETWCFPQLEDPRLGAKYNIVIINTRLTGRSVCKFSGKYDLWLRLPLREHQRGVGLLRPLAERLRPCGTAVPALPGGGARRRDRARAVHEPVVVPVLGVPAPPPPRAVLTTRRPAPLGRLRPHLCSPSALIGCTTAASTQKGPPFPLRPQIRR